MTCTATIDELRELHHPRARGYYIDLTGLVGFKTSKTVFRHPYPGSPRRVKSLVQTVIWYGLDADTGCYVRVGASKSAAAWARYYRLPRRRRTE